MSIKVGRVSTFTNKEGEIKLYFGPDYVSISSEEFRKEGAGPSASGIRFSYGVHPKTCPAFWRLARTFDGYKYRPKVSPFDPASNRITIRESDYKEEQIVILAPDVNVVQLNLNGTFDHGAHGCERNGGCFTQVRVVEEESPEVFKAIRGLMDALADDNKSRPYPKGWSMQ